MWLTVTVGLVVVSLSHCYLLYACCYLLCSNYFYKFFVLCLFSCCVCFAFFLCVLCFCIVLCIVSPHVYSRLLSICVQFYRPLPPGRNQIAVTQNHIISNLHMLPQSSGSSPGFRLRFITSFKMLVILVIMIIILHDLGHDRLVSACHINKFV